MFYSAHRAAASETNGMGHPVMTIDGACRFPRRYMPDSAREFDGFTVIPGLNRPARECGFTKQISWLQAMVIFIGCECKMKREDIERFVHPGRSYLNSHYGYAERQKPGRPNRSRQREILFENAGVWGHFQLTPAGERIFDELKEGLEDRKRDDAEKANAPPEYDTPWGW